MANLERVQWGLSNVHIAKRSETAEGVVSYATPVALKGAVNLTLEPQEESSDFYADNIAYFSTFALTKYEGELEVALVPDWFKTEYLGYKTDSAGHLISTNAQGASFAIMFQVENDESNKKYAIFNCKASKPSLEYSTIEDQVEVNTQNMSMTMNGEDSGDYRCFIAEVDSFDSLAVPVIA